MQMMLGLPMSLILTFCVTYSETNVINSEILQRVGQTRPRRAYVKCARIRLVANRAPQRQRMAFAAVGPRSSRASPRRSPWSEPAGRFGIV